MRNERASYEYYTRHERTAGTVEQVVWLILFIPLDTARSYAIDNGAFSCDGAKKHFVSQRSIFEEWQEEEARVEAAAEAAHFKTQGNDLEDSSTAWDDGFGPDAGTKKRRDPKDHLLSPDRPIDIPTIPSLAIERILNAGKNFYAILGVSRFCDQNAIKKAFRKQSLLVHPDKCHEPGAEDAFKLLSIAHESLKNPEARIEYEMELKRGSRAKAEERMSAKVERLLVKIQERRRKMQDLLPCTCEQMYHARVLTDRPIHSARYCSLHDMRHPAKEGDVWCESSMMGLKVHVYSRMQGKIYDVTEWGCCQGIHKKIPTNIHTVIMRLQGTSKARHSEYEKRSLRIEQELERIVTGHQQKQTEECNRQSQKKKKKGKKRR
eukprot:UC4_evm3s543